MSEQDQNERTESVVGENHPPEYPELLFAKPPEPANEKGGNDEIEGLLLQLMVRVDTLESRLGQKNAEIAAHDLAIQEMSQAYQVILSDLTEVEKTLHNIERAVPLVLKGADISAHVQAIRRGLGRLMIFKPSVGAKR